MENGTAPEEGNWSPKSRSLTETDRYGFQRNEKWLPISQQLKWEAEYESVLAHRRARWEDLLAKHNNLLPGKSPIVQRFVRKGIPRHLRAVAWFHYSGAEDFLAQHPNLYAELLEWSADILRSPAEDPQSAKDLETAFESIEKDLNRTFPDNIHFQTTSWSGQSRGPVLENPWLSSLRRILRTFAAYSLPNKTTWKQRPHCMYNVGYAQSLNYVAGLLLIIFARSHRNFPETDSAKILLYGYFEDDDFVRLLPDQLFAIERRVFSILCILVDKLLPVGLYQDPDLAGALLEQEVFWQGIIEKDAVEHRLGKFLSWWLMLERGQVFSRRGRKASNEAVEPFPGPLKMVTFAWMLTLFVGIFPVETTLRTWDCLFYEGFPALHRVILSLFLVQQDTLTGVRNGLEAWTMIKDLPKGIFDCHRFFEIVFANVRSVPRLTPRFRTDAKGSFRLQYSGPGVGEVEDTRLAELRRELIVSKS